MNENIDILTTFTSLGFDGLIDKVVSLLMLIIVLLYIIFSMIVVRQVYLMSDVIMTGSNKYIKFFSWLQLAFSFIFAYFILQVFVIQ